MKTILMTNAFIKDYTGSEIDTVTIANYFVKNGYCVDIFTLEKGYPLLESVDSKIRVINYPENELLLKEYDYIWAHHYFLLDYILFDKKIKAKYIHYISLSAYANYEAFPDYYKQLSLVSTLSYEAKEQNILEGYEAEYLNIFPNYVMQSQLDINYITKSKIKNICIVSNHVPDELENIKDLFIKHGINVDIYGKKHLYKLITAKLLSQYEVVISIGKTINLSLSLGIPCYIYDHFGGDGYINKKNVKESFNFNFSGRYKRNKYTSEELVKNILDGYEEALKDIKDCQKFALENFMFENIIENVFLKLHSRPMDYEKLYNDHKKVIRKAPIFVREIGRRELQIADNKLFFQLYYAKDCSYNEKDTIKIDIKTHSVYLKKIIFNEKTSVRIDLVNKSGYKIENLKINNKSLLDIENYHMSGFLIVGKAIISMDNDPWIEISNINELEISFDVNDINNDVLCKYLNDKYIKTDQLVNVQKYVKGFIKPKLIMYVEGKIIPGTFVIRNEKGNILKSTYTYSFESNKTIIETSLNSCTLYCYKKIDEAKEKLLFEYKWSRKEKIRKRLFSKKT